MMSCSPLQYQLTSFLPLQKKTSLLSNEDFSHWHKDVLKVWKHLAMQLAIINHNKSRSYGWVKREGFKFELSYYVAQHMDALRRHGTISCIYIHNTVSQWQRTLHYHRKISKHYMNKSVDRKHFSVQNPGPEGDDLVTFSFIHSFTHSSSVTTV